MFHAVSERWERFVEEHTRRAVGTYRRVLTDVDRFGLTSEQEQCVERSVRGPFRLQGVSGSGKTLVVLHRAIRLALQSPAKAVTIVTVTRALADRLRAELKDVAGFPLRNVAVEAFCDVGLRVIGVADSQGMHRLLDPLSGETVARAWVDFYRHRSPVQTVNIFVAPSVRSLIAYLRARLGGDDDVASRYLRDEMRYIRSGFFRSSRTMYLDDNRRGRGIPLNSEQRRACLQVLERWEAYLVAGGLADMEAVSLEAAEVMEDERWKDKVKANIGLGRVLVDEAQDLSTIELKVLKTLSEALEAEDVEGRGPVDRLFLAADPSQRVYVKHHDTVAAGFDFRGRAGVLDANRRNTREILRAASGVARAYPTVADASYETLDPQYSVHQGRRPVAIACGAEGHCDIAVNIACERRGCTVAIVADGGGLRKSVVAALKRKGYAVRILRDNEQCYGMGDREGRENGVVVTVSGMEAIKGHEFDVVIVLDVSHERVPRKHTPADELWREAARLYSVLTRAREELIITYSGKPSVFIDAMEDCVDRYEHLDTRGYSLGDSRIEGDGERT